MARFQILLGITLATAELLAQESAERPVRRIVVSLADRKLALIENGQVVKIYLTAVGARKSPTPTGAFLIVHRVPDPTWYTPGKIVPPGRGNPLGTRWIGLSYKGYGIHGTNEPRSIGSRASHGCIRMRNADVEELFDRINVGDPVELFAERTPELDEIFGQEPVFVAAQTGGQ
jgi:lipoprotein-anchoring transpeptidase ErfK/SrfK